MSSNNAGSFYTLDLGILAEIHKEDGWVNTTRVTHPQALHAQVLPIAGQAH